MAREFGAAVVDDMERVIAANLGDPDLSAMTADYKAGYARGFREATLAYIQRDVARKHAQLVDDLKTAFRP